jgi:hypothetical protein
MAPEPSHSLLRKQNGGVRLKIATRSKTNKLGEVERVYRILHEWLKTAKLSPGEFLSELDLAERCGTSRTPVREACTRLLQDKWLSRIPRKGFMVTPISVRDIVDMYEYRKLLECFSAEKVARIATAEQIQELHAVGSLESAVRNRRQPASEQPAIPDARLRSSPRYALHPDRTGMDRPYRHPSSHRVTSTSRGPPGNASAHR